MRDQPPPRRFCSNPATGGIVASHYLRTQGDPVASLRACLRALADQVGNRWVGLIATTGSAREIVGAYLGTEYVFNEISAHAAGAGHFDDEVDTIMEIGGQDSKYIHLRNGVPIDYAMNNACSAGTGSFLEESARSDLGVMVSDISRVALGSASPVQFKATCAAFINSDIRSAQQQGHRHDDIVAGLVYAIAANYFTKVKGPRCVGKEGFSARRRGPQQRAGLCLCSSCWPSGGDSAPSGVAGRVGRGAAGVETVASLPWRRPAN